MQDLLGIDGLRRAVEVLAGDDGEVERRSEIRESIGVGHEPEPRLGGGLGERVQLRLREPRETVERRPLGSELREPSDRGASVVGASDASHQAGLDVGRASEDPGAADDDARRREAIVDGELLHERHVREGGEVRTRRGHARREV